MTDTIWLIAIIGGGLLFACATYLVIISFQLNHISTQVEEILIELQSRRQQ
jgi:hypothetical protein